MSENGIETGPARVRRMIGVLVLLTFLAGVGAGVAGARLLGREEARPPGGSPAGPGEVVAWMSRELALDVETAERVRKIFEARRPQFDAVFARIHPDLERLRAETDDEIRAALPPEKREAFAALMSKLGPPPGSPPKGR